MEKLFHGLSFSTSVDLVGLPSHGPPHSRSKDQQLHTAILPIVKLVAGHHDKIVTSPFLVLRTVEDPTGRQCN